LGVRRFQMTRRFGGSGVAEVACEGDFRSLYTAKTPHKHPFMRSLALALLSRRWRISFSG